MSKAIIGFLALIVVLGGLTYLDLSGNLPFSLPWTPFMKHTTINQEPSSETQTPQETRSDTTTNRNTVSQTNISESSSQAEHTSAASSTTSSTATSQETYKPPYNPPSQDIIPSTLVNHTLKEIEAKVAPETHESLERAKRNIKSYYETLRKEGDVTPYFDTNTVDVDSLVELHNAFYRAFDIKELKIDNLECKVYSEELILCEYDITITVIDKKGQELTQHNHLATFTNTTGYIIQTIKIKTNEK